MTEQLIKMEILVPREAKLRQLADSIHRDIEGCSRSRQQWQQSIIALCGDMAEAREQFPDNVEFGRWCHDNRISLNDHDRAAAIAMGRDLERARTVIEATERRSLQLIHDREFRVASASKTPKPTKRAAAPKPAEPLFVEEKSVFETSPSVERTLKIEALAEQGKTSEEIVAELGVTERQVRRSRENVGVAKSIIRAKGEDVVEAEVETIRMQRMAEMEASLPKTVQAKLATFSRKLEQEFEYRVQRETQKRMSELFIPAFHKRLDDVERMLTWPRNTVMTRDEYLTILKCLHPDTARNRSDEQLAEAFRIFTHYKLKMAPEESDKREVFSGMPRTLEEMMARKDAIKEERRQARQKRKEERK